MSLHTCIDRVPTYVMYVCSDKLCASYRIVVAVCAGKKLGKKKRKRQGRKPGPRQGPVSPTTSTSTSTLSLESPGAHACTEYQQWHLRPYFASMTVNIMEPSRRCVAYNDLAQNQSASNPWTRRAPGHSPPAMSLSATSPFSITPIDHSPFSYLLGASYDFQKVVRAGYNDPLCMELALKLQGKWRYNPFGKRFYHESRIVYIEGAGLGRRMLEIISR